MDTTTTHTIEDEETEIDGMFQATAGFGRREGRELNGTAQLVNLSKTLADKAMLYIEGKLTDKETAPSMKKILGDSKTNHNVMDKLITESKVLDTIKDDATFLNSLDDRAITSMLKSSASSTGRNLQFWTNPISPPQVASLPSSCLHASRAVVTPWTGDGRGPVPAGRAFSKLSWRGPWSPNPWDTMEDASMVIASGFTGMVSMTGGGSAQARPAGSIARHHATLSTR